MTGEVHHLRVVIANGARRHVRALEAEQVLGVELIGELSRDAARVRRQLVIRSRRTGVVEPRALGALKHPVAVVRVAVDSEERGRAEVLRVLNLDDLLVVLRFVALVVRNRAGIEVAVVRRGRGDAGALRERRGAVRARGVEVVGRTPLTRRSQRAARVRHAASGSCTGSRRGTAAVRANRCPRR